MLAFIDLTGEKFGRLKVFELAEKAKSGKTRWKCECECGNITIVQSSNLRSGHTQSCGCLQSERTTTHGMTKTPTHNTWKAMMQRCYNQKNLHYADYGGRGITVCDKWLKFPGFFEDMGNRPEGKEIERIDNNKGYFKENCCWENRTIQCRNRRIPKANKTGTKGVWWDRARKKYQVNICANYKNHSLGRFETLEEAKKARTLGEQRYWR